MAKISLAAFVIIVGRADNQDADDLLQVIKERIDNSSYAILDASGGNANVSLEYGYAEALDIPRALYVSTHGRRATATTDPPIIADLAGKRRNQYKQEVALKRLLDDFSKQHSYTIRFERFLVDTGKRRGKGASGSFGPQQIAHIDFNRSYGVCWSVDTHDATPSL